MTNTLNMFCWWVSSNSHVLPCGMHNSIIICGSWTNLCKRYSYGRQSKCPDQCTVWLVARGHGSHGYRRRSRLRLRRILSCVHVGGMTDTPAATRSDGHIGPIKRKNTLKMFLSNIKHGHVYTQCDINTLEAIKYKREERLGIVRCSRVFLMLMECFTAPRIYFIRAYTPT